MNIGQLNFNGAKLKEAREARGLTQIGLSELLGISRQSINLYEKNEQNPKIDILEKISATLNLPKHFFLAPSTEEEENEIIFYRSPLRTKPMEKKSTEIKLKWFKSIIHYLQNYFEFIQVNLPKIDLPKDFKSLSLEEIEQIAESTRKFFNIGNGAISNLSVLMENNGVILNRGEFNSVIDAFSLWHGHTIPIVVHSSDKECAVRSRFDIAHELGHLILHRNITERDFFNSLKLLENQADYFAGAFMLPASTFPNDFSYPSLDTFSSLKVKWKMSIAAMIHRSKDLKILTDKHTQRMWINYSRKGWRGNEPLDDVLIPEEPLFVKRCFETLIDNNIQSRQDIESNLPYNARDIEMLSNLPEGYLREGTNNFSFISPKIKRDTEVQIFRINNSKESL